MLFMYLINSNNDSIIAIVTLTHIADCNKVVDLITLKYIRSGNYEEK